jgi:hypothetical protein
VTQLPGPRGVLSRIPSVSGTQKFSGRGQFNSCGTVNGKERRKITTASPTRAHSIGFAARRANNFHHPLRVFKNIDPKESDQRVFAVLR